MVAIIDGMLPAPYMKILSLFHNWSWQRMDCIHCLIPPALLFNVLGVWNCYPSSPVILGKKEPVGKCLLRGLTPPPTLSPNPWDICPQSSNERQSLMLDSSRGCVIYKISA